MAINRKPIRILQVFARMDRGGAETMIMELYRNVDRSKIQFDFVVHTTDKCAFDEEILALGGRIHRVPKYTGINHFKYQKAWNTLLSSYPEYRIIHAHVRSTASIFLKIAKKYGLFTIAHSHNTSSGSGIAAFFKNILQKNIFKYSDYLLAASKEAGIWLFGSDAITKDNYLVLNNAIQTDKFIYNKEIREEIRENLNLGTKTIIGHVGNFKKQKNHTFLIDVFRVYHEIDPNSMLMLIGDGKLEDTIKNKVREYDLLNSVLFLGSRSDVNDLMQAMDIFIFPSLFEGLGIVAIEAQAAGLPVIVSEAIPTETYITKNIEYISLKKSPEYWAKRINKFSKGYQRKNMREEVKNAGYDVKKTAKWLEKFYLKKQYKSQSD